MNKQATRNLLEQHFDTAFAAPDGIKKLRELILTLAMQGKLVEQDPNDPPASELLREIEKERASREGAKTRRKEKNLPPIKPEEVPYELPQGWEWVRFGEITINRDGERVPVSKEDRGQIKGEYDYYGASGVIDKVNDFIFDKSLLLIGEDGANLINRSTPIAFMAHGKYWVNNHAHVIDAHDYALLLWLEKYINAIDLKPYVTGSAQPKMNQAKMNSIAVALPPLPEQHRIVARIDQLMARCDELEKLRKEREEKRLAVHAAAIKKLLDLSFASSRLRVSQDSSSLRAFVPSCETGGAFDFLARHFGELYSVKENVAELRKAILQLAVMGRLVPQEPNDPPASELLKEIEKEKASREGAKTRRKDKQLPPIKPEEVPYELPKGWEWVRLGELGITQTGTTPPSKDRENYGDYIPFVGPGDIKNGCIDYSGEGLSEQGLSKGRLIDANSVLMVCIGGSIGKHAINERDTTCNQQINTLTPYSPVSVKYIYGVMAAVYFQNSVLSQAGGSATPIINKQKWSGIPAPIPPSPNNTASSPASTS